MAHNPWQVGQSLRVLQCLSQAGPGQKLLLLLVDAEASVSGAGSLWSKSDGYYFRSISRMQRLWEVWCLADQKGSNQLRLSRYCVFKVS